MTLPMLRSRLAVVVLSAAIALAVGSLASAQIIAPPTGGIIVPLPPPPPPPSLAVPQVPKLDAPVRQPAPRLPKSSFGDRVTRCLDDAAAGGLSPSDRATYSRMCANR